MIFFTIMFFWILFQQLNSSHFAVLRKYPSFAAERDDKLWNASIAVETYYDNESARLENEVYRRSTFCYDEFVVQANFDFLNGANNQSANHTYQMNAPFDLINSNANLTDESVETGEGACNLNSTDIYDEGYFQYFIYNESSDSYTVKEFRASNMSRDSDTWDEEFDILNDRCLNSIDCVGWTFIDAYDNNTANFMFFREAPEPEFEGTKGLGGVCMEVFRAEDYFALTVDTLAEYTDVLEDDYLSDYKTQVNEGFDALAGLWDSLVAVKNDSVGIYHAQFDVEIQEVTGEEEFDVQIELEDIDLPDNDDPDPKIIAYMYILVSCPITYVSCQEEDGFSTPELQEVVDFFSTWNTTNLTDLLNGTQANDANLTNIVDNPIPVINLPDLPGINFPPGINIPELELAIPIFVVLDILLFFFRWYKLAGAMGKILNGKDVEVRLKNLMITPWVGWCGACSCSEDAGNKKDVANPNGMSEEVKQRQKCRWCCSKDDFAEDSLEPSKDNSSEDSTEPKCGKLGECCVCICACLGCCCKHTCDFFIGCNMIFSNIAYKCWKFSFWLILLFKLFIVLLIIGVMYFVIDQVVDAHFITKIGVFDLFTFGLAAQRTVRNQILCASALSYNNLTLNNVENSRTTFVLDRNLDAWSANADELLRVEEWNAYFCPAWRSYHANPRRVYSNYDVAVTQVSSSVAFSHDNTQWNPELVDDAVLDRNSSDYFVPFTNYTFSQTTGGDAVVNITFELPLQWIKPRDNISSYWEIKTITLTWDFLPQTSSETTGYFQHGRCVEMIWKGKLNANDPWIVWPDTDTSYCGPYGYQNNTDYYNQILKMDVQWNQTRYIQVTFENAGINWGDYFKLLAVEFTGNIPTENIDCPSTIFHYWDYDASETYVEECPILTPVFGSMYRGFIREKWKDDLKEAHYSFILAVRNICLSPFYIGAVAIIILILIGIASTALIKFLETLDCMRVNLYAKVPLVDAKGGKDDPYKDGLTHSIGKAYKYDPSVSSPFFRTNLTKRKEAKDEEEKKDTNPDDRDLDKYTTKINLPGIELQPRKAKDKSSNNSDSMKTQFSMKLEDKDSVTEPQIVYKDDVKTEVVEKKIKDKPQEQTSGFRIHAGYQEQIDNLKKLNLPRDQHEQAVAFILGGNKSNKPDDTDNLAEGTGYKEQIDIIENIDDTVGESYGVVKSTYEE